jgi:hypothetical protein
VERAVDDERQQLGVERAARLCRVRPCDLGTHDDVAEQKRLLVVLHHREREHVGRVVVTRVAGVEPPDVVRADEEDRELGAGLDVLRLERVPRESRQKRLV